MSDRAPARTVMKRGRDDPPAGPRRGVVLVAMLGALLGAVTIMISPLSPWTTPLVVVGIVLVVPSAAVLVVRLLRSL